MVPLISNGEPCWAQTLRTTAGGASDGASDISTAVSVCMENRERGGRCVHVSGVKVRNVENISKCMFLHFIGAHFFSCSVLDFTM